MWVALADVIRFWIDNGVTVFRVDNPHTKSFAFWQWVIATIRRRARPRRSSSPRPSPDRA